MSAPAAPASGHRQPSALVASLAFALLCLLWGSTWVVIKEGLDDLPPLTSAGARFVLAGATMALLVPLLRAHEGGSDPPARLWLALGVGNFALSYGLVYLTTSHLPSGLVSLLWGVYPLMMAGIAHAWLPGEQLRGLQWLGFVLGFLGLVLLYAADVRSFGSQASLWALLLMLSPLVSAIGTALVKRHGAGASSLVLNRNGMLTGAVLLCAAAAVFERDAPAAWTPAAIGSVVYLALAGTVTTFGLYFWLLRTTAANRLGLIAYVTPVIALVLGTVVRGEEVQATTVSGAASILAGVLLVMRRPRS